MSNKVYIILLNYNTTADTVECLESLLKLEYDNFQILVVDNSETNKPIQELLSWAKGEKTTITTSFTEIIYPLSIKPVDCAFINEKNLVDKNKEKIIFIKANQNKGFAAGNNIALRYIKNLAESNTYVWLLNNDTIVDKFSLKNQINYFKSNENIGVLGSKLIYYDNPKKNQALGGSFNSNLYITSHICEGESVNHDINKNIKIDYVVGASMFISNNFLNEVGLLDEDFFLYFEELDWAFRAKAKGLTMNLCTDSLVYHKEGKSIGSSYDYKNRSFFSEKTLFISRKRFVKKHFKLSFKFYFSSLLLFSNRIRRGQFKIAFELLKITFLKKIV